MRRVAAILSPTSPVSPVLWYAVLGAPTAWALQFWIGYWAVQARCDRPGYATPVNLTAWTIVVGVAALAMAIGALVTSIVLFRRNAEAEEKGPPPAGRIKFLAIVGMTVAPLFIAIILMTSAGVLILMPCTQA
jgi:heme/copper-type cytochrome/quinol oxidase subunit 2